MAEHKYCGVLNPDQSRLGSSCIAPLGHAASHRDLLGVRWETTSPQPAVPSQISDAHTVAEHEMEMRQPVGFTREELTEATARQQRPAPSKEEILDTINTHMLGMHRGRVVQVLRAVDRLFEERGL